MTVNTNTAIKPNSKVHRLSTLPGVQLWQGLADHPPFERHVHLSYHIGVVFQGGQRFWHKGAKHHLGGVGIATINPDEVHDGQSATAECYDHGVIQFSEDALQNIIGTRQSLHFKDSILQAPQQF